MQPGRWIAIIGLIAPLTLPNVSTAQGSSGAQLFSAYDNSFPGGTGLAGFGLSVGAGPAAVRGSFGLSLSTFSALSTPRDAPAPPNAGRWGGDLDLILADDFFGLDQLLGGTLHPYGIAGIGAHSISSSPTFSDAVKTWSYGGGLTVPLSPAVSLQGEMRNRSQLGTAIVSPADFTSGREFRIGLDLRLGGGHRSASTGTRVPSTRGGSGASWPAGSVKASGAATRVVPRGEKYLGAPYLWGGTTPKGFDCSGFVQYVYRQEGVTLPRTSRQQAGAGMVVDVKPQAMAVGDLLLFAEPGEAISHVAIYAGNGRIIHSSASGNGVRYDDLSSQRGRWFANNLVKVRRVATGPGAYAAAALARSLIPFDHFDPPDLAPPVIRKP